MIVRRERLEDGHCCRHAGGKCRRDLAALDCGERLFERCAIRIIGACVTESRSENFHPWLVQKSSKDEWVVRLRRLRNQPRGQRAPQSSPASVQDRAPSCLLAEIKAAHAGCQSFSLSVCESLSSRRHRSRPSKNKQGIEDEDDYENKHQWQNRQSANLPPPALSAICI